MAKTILYLFSQEKKPDSCLLQVLLCYRQTPRLQELPEYLHRFYNSEKYQKIFLQLLLFVFSKHLLNFYKNQFLLCVQSPFFISFLVNIFFQSSALMFLFSLFKPAIDFATVSVKTLPPSRALLTPIRTDSHME